MPPTINYAINANGITVPTQAQLVAYFQYWYQTIYGVNLATQSSSTPDNQFVNIMIQTLLDAGDLCIQTYNSFDPDNAIGVVLDQRVAINGIQREGATFTTQYISITVTQSVNLGGMDGVITPLFVVADSAGNQYALSTSQTGLTAGTYSLLFEAVAPGQVIPVVNTITVPVTIVLGVSAINNPTTYTSLGENEESDAALKIRRQQSVSLPNQGYYDGLLAALKNIPGITYAFVDENYTNSTNADGVPAHYVWVIVAGSAAAAAIANAIYVKRNAGCGMLGSTSYAITQEDGSTFVVYWDVVVTVPIFVEFNLTSLNQINPPNITAVQNGLLSIYVPGVAAEVNINDLATFIRQIDPNSLVTSAGFSLSTSGFSNTLTPALKKNQFVLSAADIIILPMILSPAGGNVTYAGASTVTVTHGTTSQMTPLGGYGTMSYTIPTNNSGGSINSSGVYTAGATHPVTDTVKVTDALGNIATCTVSVI
jgi:uncharacterized phage protein gp47/JayE